MNPELDLMVAPLQIRFTKDVTFSHIFNYFINCGNRVSLTNDCFVGRPTTFLYFALRHNWYDVSSVVTTSLNHHIYNCFRIDDHLRIVQLENALCMFFSCRVLDMFSKRAPTFYTFVTLTIILAVHWNFHCSSCTGCHRLDWLAQWIALFFVLASLPLHNSVLVLL